MFNKTSTRLPEALLYVFRPQHSRSWKMSKLGHLVDPLSVLLNGSQYQHGSCNNFTWILLIIAVCVRLKSKVVYGPEPVGAALISAAAELFRLLPPDLEFFTRARRHGSNTPVLQETLENVLTATIVLTSTLVVLEVTSVTYPIQYEHAPLRVRCAMLCKHPPVDLVRSILSCFRKPSVGVCQVVSNSLDPGIAWPSTRFRPDLWWWFEEDTASIHRLIHSGYMAKQREEATGLDNRGKWRLLSGMMDIFIPHKIRPFEAKDSSQAPLVQHVTSKYVCFVDCPAFRCHLGHYKN